MNWNPKVMQVIETHEPRGKGVDGDPFRRIATYWTLDGNLLGEATDPEDGQDIIDDCYKLFFSNQEKLKAFKEALELIYLGDWSAISGVGLGACHAADFAEEILKKYGEFDGRD